MRICHLLAAAGISAAMLAGSVAQAQVIVGMPTGPGWHHWREHRVMVRSWGGPAYVNERGEHRGWYHWRSSYYQNCDWRWTRHHVREWQCW